MSFDIYISYDDSNNISNASVDRLILFTSLK